MGKFENKVAIITGGGNGFGARMAQILCAEGAKVVLWDVADDAASKTMETICGEVSFSHVDVRDPEAVKKAADAVAEKYGHIDILMNSAGVHQYKTGNIVTTEIDEYDRIMDTNVKGIFLCCKYVIPHMPKDGGSIVNFASAWGKIVSNNVPIYCASKAAVIHMTKAIALDFAAANIRANSLCPGTCRTHMVEGIINNNYSKFGFESPEEMWASRNEAHPLGVGTADDVAQLAIYLVSPEARWITGSAIVIDGGFTIGKSFTPAKK